ncbi:MAG TPA: hypothetical protein VLZ07_04235 [Syntrophales bacterium]|nr:hypothetical protein [Syntrophales bacterium]
MDEARHFVDYIYARDDSFGSCEILSLHPNIRAYLHDRQIESLSTAEVMNGQAFRTVMDKCEELETYLRRHLESQGIKEPAEYFVNAHWHFLRLIWRHHLWNIELLDQCLERKSYKKLFTFKYGRVVTRSPWTEDDQRYMGDIAERLCASRGIDFTALDTPPLPPRTPENELPAGWYETLCNRLAYTLFQVSASILSTKKTVLIPNFKYNMNKVCDDLIKEDGNMKVSIFYLGKSGSLELLHALAILLHVAAGKKMHKASIGRPVDFALPILTFARYHAKTYDNSIEKQYMDAVIQVLRDVKNIETVFKGVELSDLLLQKIQDDLAPYMLKVSFQVFGLEKGMEILRPDYVISQMNGEIYAALGSMAKAMNIPSVLISHGSHVYHRDRYAARENAILARNILVGGYSHYAVQSPLAREMALHADGNPGRVVNIRPSLWGRKVNRSSKRKDGLTIVQAGTLKLRHNRRYIYETSDEFLQGLVDLIDAVAPFPRLRLILKIRPDIYELSMETMKTLLPKAGNVTIEADRPFLDVLEEADLVVSFSSTTIEESLSNNVPVLLYGGHGRYSHIPVEPFSDTNGNIIRAVTFVKNREGLKEYMARLNETAASFRVPEEAFGDYRFRENEVTDLTKWILSLRKVQS